jgi:hypothetical protein
VAFVAPFKTMHEEAFQRIRNRYQKKINSIINQVSKKLVLCLCKVIVCSMNMGGGK